MSLVVKLYRPSRTTTWASHRPQGSSRSGALPGVWVGVDVGMGVGARGSGGPTPNLCQPGLCNVVQ